MNTATNNPPTIKLHRVRAGWYETATTISVGVFAIYRVDDDGGAPYWNVCQYRQTDWTQETYLDLQSVGLTGATLTDAKWELQNAINRRYETVTPPAVMRACVECSRLFDMGDPADADEYTNGHDCAA
jgi:hypothetical protein